MGKQAEGERKAMSKQWVEEEEKELRLAGNVEELLEKNQNVHRGKSSCVSCITCIVCVHFSASPHYF